MTRNLESTLPLPTRRRDVAQRNLWFASELVAILELFERASIAAVPFKGPVLAVQAYANLALRGFVDLDFLVHRRDIERAGELVLARGYVPDDSPTNWHQRFRHPSGLIVELHWEFSSHDFPYPICAEEVWPRLERVSLGGREVRSLGAEHLALLLCAHGAKHLWERAAWIGDIAALLRNRHDLDWTPVYVRARDRGAGRTVLLALQLAHDVCDAPLPSTVAELVRRNRAVQSLAVQVRTRLAERRGSPTMWERRAFYWRVRERWRDRVRDFVRTLVTLRSADVNVIRLPSPLRVLYYPIRFVRLTAKLVTRS